MKKFLLSITFAFFAITGLQTITHCADACAQQQPSIFDMSAGIKDALLQGTSKSTSQLSALNGFFGNPSVKILFPPQAQKAEHTLRGLGLGKQCDQVILSLNRAAEDAVAQAEPIFVDAIRHMSVDDAASILLGQPDAATQYFRRTTSAQLAIQFRPIIQASLNKVGATKYYGDVAKTYNKLPFVSHINPDLTDYATQQAINGIFIEIAKEELNIRRNLNARSTPLMRKVFSFADQGRKTY
jgi:ribosomal protein L30/L7E